MKTKRFDFNFRPLQVSYSISVYGSVPAKQDYNADNETYTPDYTITPLVLQPYVNIIDKDGILQSGNVNTDLANVKWYENNSSSPIESTSSDYEIVQSGSTKGQIKVKKNVKVNQPITLRFYAEYVDTRTGQLFTINMSFLVQCKNSTLSIPYLTVDAADTTIYNPIKDTDTQTVTASLRLGTTECATANRKFVWEIYRTEDGAWTEVGQDELDYDVTVSEDGVSCTVDKSLMGTELYMRCRAKYSSDGNPDSVTLTDASPFKVFSFVRRIPKYEYDIMGAPVNIPTNIEEVNPEAKVWDTNGILENAGKELLPVWYIAANKAAGALTYEQVYEGFSAVIPTEKMSVNYGAVIGLDVVDRGITGAWADLDDSLFVDADGTLLLIK